MSALDTGARSAHPEDVVFLLFGGCFDLQLLRSPGPVIRVSPFYNMSKEGKAGKAGKQAIIEKRPPDFSKFPRVP